MELGFFLIVPFSLLICYFLKKLWLISHNHNQNGESRVNFPPGSRGLLPYIGETLHFVAAIYSKHGFYSFVQARHLRYTNIIIVTLFFFPVSSYYYYVKLCIDNGKKKKELIFGKCNLC